jgi:hypothetical protein
MTDPDCPCGPCRLDREVAAVYVDLVAAAKEYLQRRGTTPETEIQLRVAIDDAGFRDVRTLLYLLPSYRTPSVVFQDLVEGELAGAREAIAKLKDGK